MSINTSEDAEADARVLTLSGPLVLRTMFEFQDCVRAGEARNLILDLGAVEYMDSAGLGAILGAFASCQRRGKRVGLTGVNARVLTLLEVTHTDQLLQRFGSVEEAKLAMKKDGSVLI